LISTVVMFQAQNRETINSTWKPWQDRVSQNYSRRERPRPRPQRARPRPIFFCLRPVLS